MSFYRSCLKHATHVRHTILWSTLNTPFYEACQARVFIKYAKHAKSVGTQSSKARKARHLADSNQPTLSKYYTNSQWIWIWCA